MLKRFGLLLTLALVAVLPQTAQAAAAVANGSNGAYGYCYGHATKDEAELCALKKCRQYKGEECKIMVSYAGSGYGAVATNSDNGPWSMGASMGKPTKVDATEAALRQCEKKGAQCQLQNSWQDTVGGSDRVSSNFRVGDRVEVKWKGRWYPARIQRVNGDNYYIRYDGYDSSWDEWVGPDRVR